MAHRRRFEKSGSSTTRPVPPGGAFATAIVVASASAAIVTCAGTARAGGFEQPDNGTEALGRGAAFTAKADDGTAVTYNVAGFARQRGTRFLLDTNVTFNSYQFQRAGTFPDDPSNPKTPWGGQPYPLVKDTSGPFPAPFVALSTDFGVFDRLTFALAAFGPSSVGQRTYPLGVQGFPAASRYDIIQANPRIIFPTFAAAYRLTPWLDVGVAAHLVVSTIDLTTTSYIDLAGVCKNAEYQPCDARSHIQTSGLTYAGSLGVMIRPASWISLGANVRSGATTDTDGTATSTAPSAAPIKVDPAPATFSTKLPWFIRAGVRLVQMKRAFEQADVEVDFTYETWGTAQGTGPVVNIPKLGVFTDIHPDVLHHYNDTFSVRLGGAYNFALGEKAEKSGRVFTVRAGGFYDSSATAPEYTRLDFDTLAKIGVTLGVGYRFGPLTANLAYAGIFESDRDVTNGQLRPINGAKNGQGVDAEGNPLPVVNNGRYSGGSHILSFGVTVIWDEVFGTLRRAPLNDYEDPDFVPPEPVPTGTADESGSGDKPEPHKSEDEP